MKILLVAAMVILLCGCGSGADSAQSKAAALVAALPMADSYTLPASTTPVYGVEAWVSGSASDGITFPVGYGAARYDTEHGAWYIAVINAEAPLTGPLFTITAGYHPVQLVRMVDINGAEIAS